MAALIAVLCCSIASAEDFEVDGIYYNILSTEDKTVEVTYRGSYSSSYDEYSGNVVIPSSVIYNGNTYSVTSIGGWAFYDCSSLTSITIPESVTSIGGGTFPYCDVLTSIQVDAENPVYDSRDNCNAIIHTESGELVAGCKNTVIPNSVTSIGWYAFYYCSGLTSITIPEGVTSIGGRAFDGCSDLTSITSPNSVTSIGNEAFNACSSLESVYSQMNTPCDYPGDFGGSPVLYIPSGTRDLYIEQGWDDWASEIVEMGDTNGDGKISITDAVAIVNYILGNPSANYVSEASDVNGDGRTSITDAVAIVNKILSGETEAKDRMARKADLLDPQ